MFCGVDGEGDGPEAIVVGPLGMIKADFAGFCELEAFDVELMKKFGVKGDV